MRPFYSNLAITRYLKSHSVLKKALTIDLGSTSKFQNESPSVFTILTYSENSIPGNKKCQLYSDQSSFSSLRLLC